MFKRNLELWIPLIGIFPFYLIYEAWLKNVPIIPIRFSMLLVLGICFAVIGKWCFFKKPWFLLKALGFLLMFGGTMMIVTYAKGVLELLYT